MFKMPPLTVAKHFLAAAVSGVFFFNIGVVFPLLTGVCSVFNFSDLRGTILEGVFSAAFPPFALVTATMSDDSTRVPVSLATGVCSATEGEFFGDDVRRPRDFLAPS